jgi:hypothetical protein
MRYVLRLLILLCGFYTVFAHGEWRPIVGDYAIAKEPLSDPTPKGQATAYVTIRGSAAKEMFLGMPRVRQVSDACGEQGTVARISGNLICYQNGKKYSCELGIRLTDGKLVGGRTC